MSILLESLDKNNRQDHDELPQLQATHFDDDMLGDDWLVARLNRWKFVAVACIALLILSWSFFTYQWLQHNDQGAYDSSLQLAKENEVLVAKKSTNESALSNIQALPEDKASQSNERQPSEDVKDLVAIDSAEQADKMQVYKPQKRQSKVETKTTQVNKNQTQADQISKGTSSELPVKQSTASRPKVFREELPPELKASFPEINIGSYVVADDPEKSFVILDGSFYKINQVIAPQMILREIGQKEIVVEFHQYMVKIPHKG
ncbi:general secretion pathway protein GspB [Aliikangiella sp. G2MR2-5]|uniref:general secretion pathway protein GspB n=1 Tax=Aliikangiella sp. G2MR2-5 TaxID=2788943 RepID=UPI0018A8C9FA|nr:general secretion pathway protein GspB [Aliikangiella sp. G2MR2-5]